MSCKRRPPLEPYKTVYLVRHGMAAHNVTGNLQLRDPRLTRDGREQAGSVRASAPVLLGRAVELVVASPLRRTLETAILAFGDQLPRPSFIAHPDAQETGVHPSDTGSEVDSDTGSEALMPEFADFDLGLCGARWYDKPAPYDVLARVRHEAGCDALRQRLERLSAWLLSRPERSIALVSHHGVFAHLAGVEMELGNCEALEATLDASGWAVQRASSEVVQVRTATGIITNYYGLTLCATVGAIGSVHGKRAAILSERRNEGAPGGGLGFVEVVKLGATSQLESHDARDAARSRASSRAGGQLPSFVSGVTSGVSAGTMPTLRRLMVSVGMIAFVALAGLSRGHGERSLRLFAREDRVFGLALPGPHLNGPNASIGPVEAKLNTVKPIRGIVIGAFGEMYALMSVSPMEAAARIKKQLIDTIGTIAARGHAQLLLARLSALAPITA
ncbi:histidine phosphatase superfamily [Pavlovales sp. CCMP2436]|nr:histidine phosphatase superfamily [Pavlovales sp. CCMP2436]